MDFLNMRLSTYSNKNDKSPTVLELSGFAFEIDMEIAPLIF